MLFRSGVRELQPQGSQCDKRGRVGDSGSKVAHTDSIRQQGQQWQTSTGKTGATGGCGEKVSNTDQAGLQKRDRSAGSAWTLASFKQCGWWDAEPNVGRVANGVAARVDRLKAIGNGQVPLCAAEAWRLLND